MTGRKRGLALFITWPDTSVISHEKQKVLRWPQAWPLLNFAACQQDNFAVCLCFTEARQHHVHQWAQHVFHSSSVKLQSWTWVALAEQPCLGFAILCLSTSRRRLQQKPITPSCFTGHKTSPPPSTEQRDIHTTCAAPPAMK